MLAPTRRRQLLIAAAGLLLFFVLREVVFRGPQAAVSRLAGYHIIYPMDSVSELFRHEKTLTYAVSYGRVLPLGRMTLTARRIPDSVVLRVRVTTEEGPLGGLLKAHAEAASLLDSATLLPRQYRQVAEFLGKSKTQVILFDYNEKTARQGESVLAIDEGVGDALSAFFLLLSQAPSREELTADFVWNMNLYTITLTPLRQRIAVVAYRAHIHRAGQPSSKGVRFTVWFAKSTTRTPVLITGWTPVGYFSVLLTGARSDEKEALVPEEEAS